MYLILISVSFFYTVIDFNGNPSNVNEDAGIAVVSLISSGAVSQEVTVGKKELCEVNFCLAH